MTIIQLNPENIDDYGFFCIKDTQSEGFKLKKQWFLKNFSTGLKAFIALDKDGKQAGYFEYMPGEFAWRPVHAEQYFFIQCMFIYPNKNRNKGLGSELVNICIEDAKKQGKMGVCTFSSRGPWIQTQNLFKKHGFEKKAKLGRFELMVLKFDESFPDPEFIDWNKSAEAYNGWHLFYSDQCPWHIKAVGMMDKTAKSYKIKLHIHEVNNPADIKNFPSGFGTFALLKDGKILEDHYLSQRRFESILDKQLSG